MFKEQVAQLSSSKILVNCGASFIGSSLYETLLDLEVNVVCLDNFAIGKRENLSAIIDHPRLSLIKGDIRNLATCLKTVEGVDYILREAALGSVPRFAEKIVKALYNTVAEKK